jgi:hypothetical protein
MGIDDYRLHKTANAMGSLDNQEKKWVGKYQDFDFMGNGLLDMADRQWLVSTPFLSEGRCQSATRS